MSENNILPFPGKEEKCECSGHPEPIKKQISSYVLREPRRWVSTLEGLPNPDVQVVIRLYDESQIMSETETEIFPAEDLKIGRFTENGWIIDPPYPKYDYSPLSHKGKINENTTVTHWAIPAEGELEGWETRFNRIREYKKLEIHVDPENEELVYKALLWGGAYIARFAGPEMDSPDSELRQYYEVLCDLQQYIDSHGIEKQA